MIFWVVFNTSIPTPFSIFFNGGPDRRPPESCVDRIVNSKPLCAYSSGEHKSYSEFVESCVAGCEPDSDPESSSASSCVELEVT